MSILNELELSKDFRFTEIKKGLVKLSFHNVAIVEAMIENDSMHIKSISETSIPIIKLDKKTGLKKMVYGGSTAYWASKLKSVLLDGNIVEDLEYRDMIYSIVSSIDRENNTHLNADGVGRNELTDRICSLSKCELVEMLKDRQKGLTLIKLLSNKTQPESGKRPRTNYSFATKFCHFMCYYLFDDEAKDNYSIFDSVMNFAIKKYITYYNIDVKGKDLQNYEDFIAIIDKVRECAYNENGDMISRNGLDHLLWFYYRGRM